MTNYHGKTRPKKRGNEFDVKLEDFGRKHYTYINSFLGDQTIRDIIVNDVKPFNRAKYGLYVEHANDTFDGRSHHVLIDCDGVLQCSTNEPGDNRVCYGFQDININKHDTLCQSYSLLLYYDIIQKYTAKPNDHESHYIIQMEMINLYREIINSKSFGEKMEDENILSYANRKAYWNDIEKSSQCVRPISGDMNKILRKLNETLNEWEAYGYLWFTGDGMWRPIGKEKLV